jgi:hypothetical protein
MLWLSLGGFQDRAETHLGVEGRDGLHDSDNS